MMKIMHRTRDSWELVRGSNTLMDPYKSNIGGPDPCDPCGVDAHGRNGEKYSDDADGVG